MRKLRPKKPPKSPKNSLSVTESQIHLAVIEYAAMVPILKKYLYHIANGGYEINQAVQCVHCMKWFKLIWFNYWASWMRSKLLKMGLRPGMPDLHLAYPTSKYPGLFIELKAPGKKPSPEQIEVMDDLKKVGFAVFVSDSVDGTIQILKDYLSGETY